MGRWNDGKLEYWNAGRRSRQFSTLHHSIIPTFQYSNVPVFKSPTNERYNSSRFVRGSKVG